MDSAVDANPPLRMRLGCHGKRLFHPPPLSQAVFRKSFISLKTKDLLAIKAAVSLALEPRLPSTRL